MLIRWFSEGINHLFKTSAAKHLKSVIITMVILRRWRQHDYSLRGSSIVLHVGLIGPQVMVGLSFLVEINFDGCMREFD